MKACKISAKYVIKDVNFFASRCEIYLGIFILNSSAHQSTVRTTIPHVKERFCRDLTPEILQHNNFNIMNCWHIYLQHDEQISTIQINHDCLSFVMF